MSAYVVSDATISVLVDGFMNYGDIYAPYTFYEAPKGWIIDINEERQAIGQALLDYNYKSVNYRYGEDEKPRKFMYEVVPESYKLNRLVGCIHCYNYQACEPDDYYESDIYKALQQLKTNILDREAKKYGELEWGVRD